ncbi:hypothetical protein [Streptomyces sp. NPDC093111]|uniref:hypothetical protein n=1 Tax=Streptomyces sp. NPDC093111 TaxID=3154978 RepID=UPI0034296F00
MDEQPHDRSAETLVSVDLGAALDEAADITEAHIEEEAERHIGYALRLQRHCPDDVALAHLTDSLISYCSSLAQGVSMIPAVERPSRGTAAVETWTQLVKAGPDTGPLANWSYARQLGLIGRDLLQTLQYHRRADRHAAFIGRTELPPVAVDRP